MKETNTIKNGNDWSVLLLEFKIRSINMATPNLIMECEVMPVNVSLPSTLVLWLPASYMGLPLVKGYIFPPIFSHLCDNEYIIRKPKPSLGGSQVEFIHIAAPMHFFETGQYWFGESDVFLDEPANSVIDYREYPNISQLDLTRVHQLNLVPSDYIIADNPNGESDLICTIVRGDELTDNKIKLTSEDVYTFTSIDSRYEST